MSSVASQRALSRASWIGLCLLAVGAGPVLGQSDDWPDVGDQVRISSSRTSGEYQVAGLLDNALVLREEAVPNEYTVDVNSMFGLEVYQGRRSRLWGTILGTLGGGAFGGLLGVPCAVLPHTNCEITPTTRALAGAGIGAVVGLVMIGGREMWEEVQLPDRAGTVLAGAPGPARGTDGEGRADDRSNRDVITYDEILQEGSAYGNAYELVRGRRSTWMTARATTTTGGAGGTGGRSLPRVVVDGVPYGEMEELRGIPVTQLERLEWVDPRDATTRFGLNFDGGAIFVTLR